MPAAPFDTSRFASRLKAAGVSAPQAEAQASALGDAFQSLSVDQASKAVVREASVSVVQVLRSEMQELRQELRSEMQALAIELRAELHLLRVHVETGFARIDGELELLRWMMGLLLAGVASLVLKTFS